MFRRSFAEDFLAQRISWLFVRRMLDSPWNVHDIARRSYRSVRWVRNKLSGRNLRAMDIGRLSAALECDLEVEAVPKGRLLTWPQHAPRHTPAGLVHPRAVSGLPKTETSAAALLVNMENEERAILAYLKGEE